MKVLRRDAVEAKDVVEPGASGTVIRELISAETGAPNFAMRLFHMEPGGHTPYHHHPWEHEVYILSGRGEHLGESGETTAFAAGDAVFVPPDEPHQFRNSGEEALRFICVIPIQ